MNSEGKEVEICQIDNEKDIGVTFNNKMKFDTHIANIVNKANQRLGLIKRSFEFIDKDMFLLLYKSLVRPILEYATVIWSPWLKKDIVAIEQVQRRATRLVYELNDLDYEQRLRTLGLPTLIYRRERADMIQMFKALNQIDQVHMSTLKLKSTTTTSRGHDLKLEKRHYKYKATMNSFVARSTNNWNGLPTSCVTSSNVNKFKDNINAAWKHKSNKFYMTF